MEQESSRGRSVHLNSAERREETHRTQGEARQQERHVCVMDHQPGGAGDTPNTDRNQEDQMPSVQSRIPDRCLNPPRSVLRIRFLRSPEPALSRSMGITQLSDLIAEEAPGAITTRTPDHYRGKVLAIDASIVIHQFHSAAPTIINRNGEEISVLQGLFHRTVFMLQNEIRPLYVFDGIPPENKRLRGTKDGKVQRSSRRATPVSAPESDRYKDLKTLLTHLGVPYIQAPSEAEATCAHLVVEKVAWGAVTEDMDALPFSCPRLIRNLKADKNIEIKEYDLPTILSKLNLSKEQFVDLCILLGCDYTTKIKGLGRKKALKMIQKHKNIEGIIEEIKSEDRTPPDFDYITARRQFLHPVVATVSPNDLTWRKPDEEKVRQFLSGEKHMKEARVTSVLQKLHPPKKTQKRRSKMSESPPRKQMKINKFFRVTKVAHEVKPSPGTRPVSSAE